MVFNNLYCVYIYIYIYILCTCWSLSKKCGIPHLQGCMVCCSWNFVITPILPTSNSSFLRGQSGQIFAKCRTVHNNPYFTTCLNTLAFSCVPCIMVPLSIMVSTIGLISSLIASICEDNIVCVKDPLELG